MTRPLDLAESRLAMRDGARLFLRRARVSGATRANVVLIHGMGEHSSRYLHVAEKLAQHGFGACLFDLRGHGSSDGRRGHIKNYQQLMDDIGTVWQEVAGAGRPLFLYGHSLGGQLALNFALDARQPSPTGVIAASPWLDLAFIPRWWKRWLARVARHLWPGFTQVTEVIPTRLSRDQAFLEAMPDRDLVHHLISARMYHELTNGARRARARASKFRAPLYLIHGDADAVTSAAATRAFFEKAVSPDKTLRIYPGGLHETHNDLDRETVLLDLLAWLDARSR